jgi:replicative DNA helicase
MIFSYEIEKQVLSGILQHQHKWAEIASFVKDSDFYSEDSKVNISIFKLVRNALDNAEAIDETILVQRLNQLKVSFPDSIDLAEYVYSLAYYKISEDVFISSVKELKKFSARRGIYDSCKEVANFVKKADPNLKYSEIIDKADQLYNKTIKDFEMSDSGPVNLFEIMEPMIEDRGNNPVTDFGLMGPHPRINELYGSLLRGGNIAVCTARSGAGKSSLAMDFATKTSVLNDNVPVLHFDNGEMSEEELIMRQMSAMTGLPMYLFETGKWRSCTYDGMESREVVDLVRSTFSKIQGMKFYYENVAGMSSDEMSSLLKRFYYSKVGRGNKLIFSFDYIKSDFGNMGKADGWQQVAYMVHKFKQTIHRDLCFDGDRPVAMFTSVQSNRLGITTNRGVDAIVDDESVVSLSDGITQFCSHMFLLRKKVAEELHSEGARFGTHKLINLKARHLGSDPLRAINPVVMPDGTHKNNFINLEFKNFKITEKGDLLDMINAQNNQNINIREEDFDDNVPLILTND